ncbi:MAG: guanylate kinase [Planctomycetota bacterium]|nr:MAG: guanylate kinase [Planctomycetota bacterium]
MLRPPGNAAHRSGMPMSDQKRGKLVVISGPSGTGKTSICDGLLERIPDAVWSVSVTTRPKRGHEVDGRAYRFVSDEEFDRMLESGELLEHATYVNHRYGTPRRPVEEALAQGKVVIMEIDYQGAAQVAEKIPDSIRVFVLPPTRETLRARLEGRRTESEELQRRRLEKADGEIAFAMASGVYPYIITNDILEDSIQQVMDIIDKEQAKA